MVRAPGCFTCFQRAVSMSELASWQDLPCYKQRTESWFWICLPMLLFLCLAQSELQPRVLLQVDRLREQSTHAAVCKLRARHSLRLDCFGGLGKSQFHPSPHACCCSCLSQHKSCQL